MTPHTGISALPHPAETWAGADRSESDTPSSQAKSGFADLLENRQEPADDRRLAAEAPPQTAASIVASGAKSAAKGGSRNRAARQTLRPANISLSPDSNLLSARGANLAFSARPLTTQTASENVEAKPLIKKSILAKSASAGDGTNSQAILSAAHPINHPASPKVANADRGAASSRSRSENLTPANRDSLASAKELGAENSTQATAESPANSANAPAPNSAGELAEAARQEASETTLETATQGESTTATDACSTETEASQASLSKTAGQTLPRDGFEPVTTETEIPKEVLAANAAETAETAGDANTADSLPNNSDRKENAKLGAQSPLLQTTLPPIGEGGMSDASSNLQMNLARKMNEFAPAAEQLLPAEGQALAGLETSAAEPRAGRASENPWGSSLLIPSAASSITAQATSAEKTEAAADTTSQVEKLADLVARQAVELKKVNALQMNAVLRPDAQTELHLSLRLAEGKVEVHAQCNAENQQALSAQWSQIQQALAPQGIRLANLNDNTPQWANQNAFGGTSNPANQQSSNHQEARRQQAPASSEEDNLLSVAVSEKTAARTPRISRADGLRWESWA